jgi:16S rRNA processing protein RimM
VGLEVLSTNGPSLGKVVGLLETGANDVLEVRGDRERLIPFVLGEYIKELDLEAGYLIADWDPDF